MENKITYSDIRTDVESVAKEAGISPSELTILKYKKHGGKYSDREIRNAVGGLSTFIKEAFPEQEKNLAEIAGTRQRSSYLKRLEKDLGDRLYFGEKLTKALVDHYKNFPIQLRKQKIVKTTNRKETERFNIVTLSDTHFGKSVDPREVEGARYDWTVAARRLGRYADATANYKFDHRKECGGLIINLLDDLIEGIIHLDDTNIDLITMQIIGAQRYLVQFIDYQLQFYPEIRIYATPGNHSRVYTAIKGSNRATAQKYDSYFTLVVEYLKAVFRNEHRVRVFQPMTAYTTYKVFEHDVLLFHGDTHIVIGNPSRSLDIRTYSQKLDSFIAGNPSLKKLDIVFSGHVHFGCFALLDNGANFFVSPSMIGAEPYGQTNERFGNNAGQWIVESVKEYPVGDMRLCELKQADQNDSYEEIINPFDGNL